MKIRPYMAVAVAMVVDKSPAHPDVNKLAIKLVFLPSNTIVLLQL